MIICAGTVLIDCIVTESGTESVADSITLAPGGEAFNEAVSLARLGEKVLLIVPTGQDAAGDMIRAMLDREGIILQADYRGATPVSLLTVNAAGGRKSRVSKVHALTGYRPQLPCLDPQLSGSDPQLPSIKSVTFVTMASLFRPPFLDPADPVGGFLRIPSCRKGRIRSWPIIVKRSRCWTGSRRTKPKHCIIRMPHPLWKPPRSSVPMGSATLSSSWRNEAVMSSRSKARLLLSLPFRSNASMASAQETLLTQA